MIADDRLDEMARECRVAMRLADDPGQLSGASMHLLFRSGATLTRAIVLSERTSSPGPDIADLPTLSTARQRIMTEIRRRT